MKKIILFQLREENFLEESIVTKHARKKSIQQLHYSFKTQRQIS